MCMAAVYYSGEGGVWAKLWLVSLQVASSLGSSAGYEGVAASEIFFRTRRIQRID